MDKQTKKRVFSGMQPSGQLHLGNYLGALKQWAAHQDEKENFFCIVDLHAITLPQDPEVLRNMTRDVAATYFAAGLDPDVSTVFIQSHVKEHAELAWIFNCLTPLGWLERMTQYKVKAAAQESVGTGLLVYPTLMAADIVIYDANEVPVGEDQKQHVELTRDIAIRFNYLYGDTFVVPEPVIPKSGARVMGFDEPTKKMSKSESSARGHALKIVDEPDEIRWVIKHAKTDSGNEILFSEDPAKAGVNNLLEIYEQFTGMTRPEIEAHFAAARGYGDLKKEVVEVAVEGLRPIRERYNQIISDPGELDRLLEIGAEKARSYAVPKLDEVKQKVGFILPRK